jgi:hypothetical protein
VGAQCLDLSFLQIAPLPGAVLVSLSVVQQVLQVVQLVREVNVWGAIHRLSLIVTLSDVLETSADERLRVKKGKEVERAPPGRLGSSRRATYAPSHRRRTPQKRGQPLGP